MQKKKRVTPEDGVATKLDLDNLAKDLSQDIRNNINASENRLNHRIDRVMEYIDFKTKPIDEMRQDYRDFKSRIFDRLDWLIGAYEKFNQEMIILNKYVKDSHDRIENHEARLVQLERPLQN